MSIEGTWKLVFADNFSEYCKKNGVSKLEKRRLGASRIEFRCEPSLIAQQVRTKSVDCADVAFIRQKTDIESNEIADYYEDDVWVTKYPDGQTRSVSVQEGHLKILLNGNGVRCHRFYKRVSGEEKKRETGGHWKLVGMKNFDEYCAKNGVSKSAKEELASFVHVTRRGGKEREEVFSLERKKQSKTKDIDPNAAEGRFTTIPHEAGVRVRVVTSSRRKRVIQERNGVKLTRIYRKVKEDRKTQQGGRLGRLEQVLIVIFVLTIMWTLSQSPLFARIEHPI